MTSDIDNILESKWICIKSVNRPDFNADNFLNLNIITNFVKGEEYSIHDIIRFSDNIDKYFMIKFEYLSKMREDKIKDILDE